MRGLRNSLFVLVLLVTLGLAVLLGTNTGFRVILAAVNATGAVSIGVADSTGSLARGLEIDGLRIDSPAANLAADRVVLDMTTLALLRGRLHIAKLYLNGIDVKLNPTPAAPQEGTAGLPLTIDIDELEINRLALSSAEGKRFALDHIDLGLRADADSLAFSDLSLYSEFAAVHGQGEVRYRPPLQAEADLSWTLEKNDTLPALGGTTRIRGDAGELTVDTALGQPFQGNLHLVLRDLTKQLHWQAVLDTEPFNPGNIREGLPELKLAASLQANGSLSGLSAQGDLVLSAINIPGVELGGRTDNGDLTLGLDINARRQGDQYLANGDIDWSPVAMALPQQDARFSVPAGSLAVSLDSGVVNIRTRTSFDFNQRSGNLALSAAGTPDAMTLQALDIALDEGRMHAQGRVETADGLGSLKLDSHWQDINIPVAGRSLESPQGRLSLDGRLDDYRLSGDARLSVTGLPATGIRLTASGNRERLNLEPLTLVLLNGTASITGNLHWTDPAGLEVDLQAEGLNPGRQWPEWPGQLALAGHVKAATAADGPQVTVSGLKLSGQLRQRPLTLNLDGSLHGTTVSLQQARLASGDAIVQAGGKWNPADSDLQWRLKVPDLGIFLPDAAGSIHGEGLYRGNLARPIISGNLEAANLQSRWLNLAGMDTDMDIDLHDAGRIEVNADVQGLARGNLHLKELQLQVQGSAASHRYRLAADNEDTRISLAGEGSYGVAEHRWQGRTGEFTVTDKRLGTWQLQKPVVTSVARGQFQTQPLCLQQEQANTCVQGDWRDNGDWQAGVTMKTVPLSIGKPWFPYYLTTGGNFDLDLSLAVRDGRPSGNGKLQLMPGHVDFRIDEDETQRFDIKGGNAEMSLQADRLDGHAQLDIAGLSVPVQTSFSLTGLAPWPPDPEKVALQGALTGRVDDLEFIASMTPYVTDTHGNIRIDLNAGGTLDKPGIQGDFQLAGAGFHAPDLGVAIQRLNIHGTTTEEGEYRFRGEWHSGDGIARIDARLDKMPDGGLALKADVTGDHTEIVNLPEIQAQATPDLELAFSPRRKTVSGDILINKALIDLGEMTSKTPVSDDIVIVDGNTEQTRKPSPNLETDLTIRFGDDIRIRGKGIKGDLGGQLAIQNNDKGDVIATGEVNISNGSFSAYGQSLTIEEGRLIYQKSRLDNPEVRIRAVRQVDDIKAGIRVSGYLANPTVTMFSVPAMNQEEILSYIVFGRPLSSLSSGEGADLMSAATSLGLQNSGFLTSSLANTFGLDTLKVKTQPGTGVQNASLIVGKYLTPNLYLSYGIGLFETINTATIRYDISKHWAVEAQQGSEMGADILYKLEK